MDGITPGIGTIRGMILQVPVYCLSQSWATDCLEDQPDSRLLPRGMEAELLLLLELPLEKTQMAPPHHESGDPGPGAREMLDGE